MLEAEAIHEDERRLRLLLVAVLLATIVGGAIDFVWDGPESWLSAHALYELALIAFAMVAAATLWRGWWRARRSLVATRSALVEDRAERDAWRATAEQALKGLGQAMNERFDVWALTPAEREVALLLLKGQSHKHIAYVTGRSERTIRQHAVAVYHKSGLGGRAELAAFFLEDLQLPAALAQPGGAREH